MTLPTSGTYKLTVGFLGGWLGHNRNNGVPNGIARYWVGKYGTQIWKNVDVTFHPGGYITWPGGSATIGDQPNRVPVGEKDPSAAIYNSNSNPGTFILLAKDGDNPIYNNGQSIDHHFYNKNDDFYWNYKDFAYNQGVDFSPCFLKGTLILTPNGNIPVEDLKIGDELITINPTNNEKTICPVVWVGKSHCDVATNKHDDEAGYAVRILKNAISEGVPFKDLLVTPEHCLFFNGKFVPVRMLVNGQSIFYDTSIVSYDYYHVETENHSIIVSDGMLTESYLDTGNRSIFKQDGSIVAINTNRNLSWNDDSAVPLDVSREFVEPLFNSIKENANLLECKDHNSNYTITDDNALFLLTDKGNYINKLSINGKNVNFLIPSNVKSVKIISHSSRPCDAIGPFIDDRRYFGVRISEINILESNTSRSITTHLTENNLEGWHTEFNNNTRWTTGEAILPLEKQSDNSLRILTIKIEESGYYIIKDSYFDDVRISA